MCYSWLCHGTVSSLCCISFLGASCFLLLSSNTGKRGVILPKLRAAASLAPAAGLPRLSVSREGILLLCSTRLPVSPLLPWDPYSCFTLIRILFSNPGAPMSWRGGGFSTGEALVVPTSVSPCESVPEPTAPAVLEDFGEGRCLPSPRLAFEPLPHSLSAITAVSLVRASAVQAVPGKSQARGSFPGWGSCHAPSQAPPSVRLPVPGEERRWGKGSLGSSLNPSPAGRFFSASPKPFSLCPGKAVCWKRVCAC